MIVLIKPNAKNLKDDLKWTESAHASLTGRWLLCSSRVWVTLKKSSLQGVQNYRQTLTGASLSCKLDFNSRMRRRSLVASLPASKRWLCNRSLARTLSPTLSLWFNLPKEFSWFLHLNALFVFAQLVLIAFSALRIMFVASLSSCCARNLTSWSTKGQLPES